MVAMFHTEVCVLTHIVADPEGAQLYPAGAWKGAGKAHGAETDARHGFAAQ